MKRRILIFAVVLAAGLGLFFGYEWLAGRINIPNALGVAHYSVSRLISVAGAFVIRHNTPIILVTIFFVARVAFRER